MLGGHVSIENINRRDVGLDHLATLGQNPLNPHSYRMDLKGEHGLLQFDPEN